MICAEFCQEEFSGFREAVGGPALRGPNDPPASVAHGTSRAGLQVQNDGNKPCTKLH